QADDATQAGSIPGDCGRNLEGRGYSVPTSPPERFLPRKDNDTMIADPLLQQLERLDRASSQLREMANHSCIELADSLLVGVQAAVSRAALDVERQAELLGQALAAMTVGASA